MKFVRIRGRIVPIKDKGGQPSTGNKVASAALAGGAATLGAGKIAQAAGSHLTRKAGNIFNSMHYLNQMTMGLGDGSEVKPLLSMIRKGRTLQSVGKKAALVGAGIGLLGTIGVLATSMKNKLRNKK